MKRVFISLPMSGRTDEEIAADIEKAKEEYLNVTRENSSSVMFIDNFDAGKPMMYSSDSGFEFPKHESIWYLAIALRQLSRCDTAFFYGDWKNARGCRIEKKVCDEYGIPTLAYIGGHK